MKAPIADGPAGNPPPGEAGTERSGFEVKRDHPRRSSIIPPVRHRVGPTWQSSIDCDTAGRAHDLVVSTRECGGAEGNAGVSGNESAMEVVPPIPVS